MTDADPPAALAPPLHLPQGLRYECIRCGRSCAEFWEIPVDPESAASIRTVPPEVLVGARDPSNPVVESEWTPGRLVMRLKDGCCCLRRDDHLCALHAALGFDAKPNICRSFPYRFVETPGGVWVGLSFACTAVLGNLGPAVADQRPALEALYGWTHSRRTAPEPIALTADLTLTWDQYRRIEADLLDLLDPQWGPLGLRLRAQAIYLQLLVNLLRRQRMELGVRDEDPQAVERALTVVRARMRGDPARPWALPLDLARKGRPSELLRRAVLGMAHALRNTSGRRRGRAATYVRVTSGYLAHVVGWGVIDLPALRRPVSYRRLRAVRYDPDRPDCSELLTRYFRHAIERKDLLLSDSVRLGHQMKLLHWGLLHWYGAAMAADAGSPTVELDHLREALRNVEKYFAYHSTFHQLFSRFPLLRTFMDSLFANPHFTVSVGRGPWEPRSA